MHGWIPNSMMHGWIILGQSHFDILDALPYFIVEQHPPIYLLYSLSINQIIPNQGTYLIYLILNHHHRY